jgi:hypothetical protein
MPFQARIRELSKHLAECNDDERALKLAQELQAALHEEIEQLRTKAETFPLLNNQNRC